MPLKRPNPRILAKSALRMAIDEYFDEQTIHAREEAAHKVTMDKILAGKLSFGETFDEDGPDYLPFEVRDEFIREHGYLFISSGSHYADDPRNDIRDDEPYITADDADFGIDDSWYERYGGHNVHETHGVPRLGYHE